MKLNEIYLQRWEWIYILTLQKFKCGINVVYGYDEFGDID